MRLNTIGDIVSFSLQDKFIHCYGSQDDLLDKHGINNKAIYKKVIKTYMKSAILVKSKKPLVIGEVILPKELEFGQVLVKIFYSGICGSQINEIDSIKNQISIFHIY